MARIIVINEVHQEYAPLLIARNSKQMRGRFTGRAWTTWLAESIDVHLSLHCQDLTAMIVGLHNYPTYWDESLLRMLIDYKDIAGRIFKTCGERFW